MVTTSSDSSNVPLKEKLIFISSGDSERAAGVENTTMY